jgi:hypothetical protein
MIIAGMIIMVVVWQRQPRTQDLSQDLSNVG